MVVPERAGVFSFAAQPKRFWRSARTLSSEKTHPIGRQVLQPLKNTLSGPDSQRILMVGGTLRGILLRRQLQSAFASFIWHMQPDLPILIYSTLSQFRYAR
jgi:hypothetical protein